MDSADFGCGGCPRIERETRECRTTMVEAANSAAGCFGATSDTDSEAVSVVVVVECEADFVVACDEAGFAGNSEVYFVGGNSEVDFVANSEAGSDIGFEEGNSKVDFVACSASAECS